jgi:acetyl esterase
MRRFLSPVHPETSLFLAKLDRPGAPPFHTLPLELQRAASEKMQFAFRPEAPEVAQAHEGWIPRDASAGGPLRYRLYRPLDSLMSEALPLLIWFHGGGWCIGNIESYDVMCREIANQSDCAVLSLAYRLAPEFPFPAAPDDAFYALNWITDQASALAIDPARIAVGGDSAGGNLAAVTALAARDAGSPAIAFQLLIYPSTDQRGITPSHSTFAEGYLLSQESIRGFQHHYLPDRTCFTDWRASPLLAASHAALPPALMITASHDPLVDDCRTYAQRLETNGVTVRYSEYSGMVHGFFTLGRAFTDANRAVTEAATALREALNP